MKNGTLYLLQYLKLYNHNITLVLPMDLRQYPRQKKVKSVSELQPVKTVK
ncbi:hypothetical protein H4683_003053 [Filibacter limicola]|uniref:Uncharacterized protein n=1 Tax=Sporosarcina limicola TaxID=34101 RepID=A0A927RFW1_9BACL|nr:hypothetical protein [Sporosarcina limicola]